MIQLKCPLSYSEVSVSYDWYGVSPSTSTITENLFKKKQHTIILKLEN